MIEAIGERITLRSMTREEYHQARQDYVPDPMMDPGPYQYDAEKVDRDYDSMLEKESWYPRAGIFRNDTGEIIGEISFKRIDREKSRCEIGIALSHNGHKEQGYGGEAFALALRYALDVLKLDHVYADTMGSNVRMQRILDRLGFSCFLRLEECYNMGDRWEDRLDYVLHRTC